MRKILVIVVSCSSLGGVETVTRELVGWLAGHFDIGMVTHRPETAIKGVSSLWSLPDKTDFNSPRNLDFIENLIRKNGYEVIINQGCQSLVYKRFAQDAGHRFIQVLHQSPSWLAYHEKHPSVPGRNCGWKQILRYLLKRWLPFFARARAYSRLVDELRSSAAYVVLDESYRQELIRMNVVDESRICAIPNPVNRQFVKSGRQKTVLYAGRFYNRQKHLDRLLKIWKSIEDSHPQWHLQFVGDGPDAGNLEALARRLHLKRFEMHPPCNDESLYSRASILCLTSSYEGLSMSVIEAQQAGVVPVAFDINGGMRALIGENEYGLLVKPFRKKEYAQALGHLMDDTIRRDRMADDAMRHARFYSMDRIGPMWVELIEKS